MNALCLGVHYSYNSAPVLYRAEAHEVQGLSSSGDTEVDGHAEHTTSSCLINILFEFAEFKWSNCEFILFISPDTTNLSPHVSFAMLQFEY